MPRCAPPPRGATCSSTRATSRAAPPREPFAAALRAGGRELRIIDAVAGAPEAPAVVAVFGDIRSWKGRPGYSAQSRDAVLRACDAARAGGRDPVVVQFSHPRLAAELDG